MVCIVCLIIQKPKNQQNLNNQKSRGGWNSHFFVQKVSPPPILPDDHLFLFFSSSHFTPERNACFGCVDFLNRVAQIHCVRRSFPTMFPITQTTHA